MVNVSDPPKSGPPTTSFEYNFIQLSTDAKGDEIVDVLNGHGKAGWVVIKMVRAGGFYNVLLMRNL
jgi:hypothetical protein